MHLLSRRILSSQDKNIYIRKALRDTTHRIVALQVKIFQTERTIHIQLVRATEVSCKVLSDING